MKHLLVSYHTCPTEVPGQHLAGGMNVLLRGFLEHTSWPTEVVTRSLGDYQCLTLSPQVRLHRLPCQAPSNWDREAAWNCLPAFGEALQQWLGERDRPQAISAHYWMSGWLLPQLGLEGGIMFHTLQAQKGAPRGPLERLRREWEDRLIGRYPSAFLHWHDLHNARQHYPELQAQVVRPGLSLSAPVQPRQPNQPLVFGWAARNDPIKNLDQALGWLPPGSHLRVAGMSGPRRPDVTFLGSLEHHQMRDFYTGLDQLLNLSDYETFGLSLLEALACATPIGVPAHSHWARRLRRLGLPYLPGQSWTQQDRNQAQKWALGHLWPRALPSWERWLLRLSSGQGE